MIRTFTYMMFTQVEETLTNDMLLLTDDFIRGVSEKYTNWTYKQHILSQGSPRERLQ